MDWICGKSTWVFPTGLILGNILIHALKGVWTAIYRRQKEMTIIAGVYAKFPPMAVKLKGDTAAINPSIPRSLSLFTVTSGSGLLGCHLAPSLAYKALNL